MEHELEITVKWENDKGFSVDAKLDDGDVITISKHEENGDIKVLWPHIQKTLETYWKTTLAHIGEEMKE